MTITFHLDKCKVCLSTRIEDAYYKLVHTSLEHTEYEKDLGFIIDNKLKFSEHINQMVNKDNSIMGVIRRSFRFLDPQTFLKLYKSRVRPHLEYTVAVWNLHLKKDIKNIESVQRRATKQLVMHVYTGIARS